jgi:serine/threonine protein kinase
VVAVKKICAYNPEASHELNVLRNLRKQQHLHHHLLPLVAAYKQHDCLFLILPWAEADLNQYWKMNDPTSLGKSAELSTWLKQQCYGIAEAVSRIHRYDTTSGTMMLSSDTSLEPNPKSAQRHPQSNQSPDPPNRKTLFGRHGDIKPANILWFPGKRSDRCFGTLKLSDFGTTHFSDGQRNSMQDNYTVPYSRSYQSPECRLPDGQISSQCDVWAMGCVFLEFVCWYVGGYELLNKFEHERLLAGGLEGSSFFSFKPEDNPQSDALRLKAPVIKVRNPEYRLQSWKYD